LKVESGKWKNENFCGALFLATGYPWFRYRFIPTLWWLGLPQLRTESPTTVASERLRRHYYPGGAFA